MDSKSAISLGIIITELVSNSFKHAFHDITDPVLFIKLSKDKSTNSLQLIVCDNGKGINNINAVKKGLGKRLVDIFSRQLNGDYMMETEDGFKYVLNFKAV